MNKSSRSVPLICVLLLQLALVPTVDAADVPIRVVALSEEHAPGTPAGADFARFDNVQIDGQSHVVFKGTLHRNSGGVTSVNDIGIWQDSETGLILRGRTGSQAYGMPGDYKYLGEPIVNSAGAFAFKARTTSTIVDRNAAIWGGLQLTKESYTAPGTSSRFADLWYETQAYCQSKSGRKAFSSAYMSQSPPLLPDGVWAEGSIFLTDVILKSEVLPGVADSRFSFSRHVSMNAQHYVLLHANYWAIPPEPNGSGLWMKRGTPLHHIAHTNGQAPGLPEGVVFQEVPFGSLNNAGDVVFPARLSTASEHVTYNDDTGVWFGTPGALQLLAREGAPAPGTEEGTVFGHFDTNFDRSARMYGADEAAFRTVVEGPTGSFDGIWIGRPGTLRPFLLAGDPAPDLPPGTVFTSLSSIVVNESGSMAVLAYAGGTYGVWAHDSSGRFRLALARDDVLEVLPGDMRIVNSFELRTISNGQDGLGLSFNANNQLALVVGFQDGSDGVAVVDLFLDCNENGTSDDLDLADGVSEDCNGNLLPDDCDQGDADGDSRSTLADFGALQTCFTSDSGGPIAPCCSYFDLDRDGDIDYVDHDMFTDLLMASGPGRD